MRKREPTVHLSFAERAKRLKITVVGDGNVGKTSILMTYAINRFPREYLPTVFDTHTMHIKVEDVDYAVTLWDTAGQEEYARLRPLSYPNTDCFIVCYSIDNLSSFTNVKKVWIPEVRKYCPRAAVILVGTKLDLKTPTSKPFVTVSDVNNLKRKIGAQFALECSSKTRENLDEVFIAAVRGVLKVRSQQGFSCSCL